MSCFARTFQKFSKMPVDGASAAKGSKRKRLKVSYSEHYLEYFTCEGFCALRSGECMQNDRVTIGS